MDKALVVNVIREAAWVQSCFGLARFSEAEDRHGKACLPTSERVLKLHPLGALRRKLYTRRIEPQPAREVVAEFERAFFELHGMPCWEMTLSALNEHTMAERMRAVANKLEMQGYEKATCPRCAGRGFVPVVVQRDDERTGPAGNGDEAG